jgi:hypothetical protein
LKLPRVSGRGDERALAAVVQPEKRFFLKLWSSRRRKVAIVSNTPSTDADCNLDLLREESKLQSEKRGYAPWIAAAFFKGR